MNWQIYCWVWKLRSPVFIGRPPAGVLNRTRLYVPARTLWGAVTAELARREGEWFPDAYAEFGKEIKSNIRFTYLYPAQKKAAYLPWLPGYKYETGLSWEYQDPEHSKSASNRRFRTALLHTRPGTAIDPDTDTAADGSLRETECIQPYWRRCHQVSDGSETVFLLGYVYIKHGDWVEKLSALNELFLGGDNRYGLGTITREKWETDHKPFGLPVVLNEKDPVIKSKRLLAHSPTGKSLLGDKELVLGWNRKKKGYEMSDLNNSALWTPGSWRDETISWKIKENGFWVEC